jgi:hypothetical protein
MGDPHDAAGAVVLGKFAIHNDKVPIRPGGGRQPRQGQGKSRQQRRQQRQGQDTLQVPLHGGISFHHGRVPPGLRRGEQDEAAMEHSSPITGPWRPFLSSLYA